MSAPVNPELLEELHKLQESTVIVRYDVDGVYGEIHRPIPEGPVTTEE